MELTTKQNINMKGKYKMKKYTGVVYSLGQVLSRGKIIELYTEENNTEAQSVYILINEVNLVQNHKVSEVEFKVVEVEGINVSEVFI